jgi:hypothetical protein
MRIVKLYTKRNNDPQYFLLNRIEDNRILVNYPISKPDRFRVARWFNTNEVQVVWIKSFIGE